MAELRLRLSEDVARWLAEAAAEAGTTPEELAAELLCKHTQRRYEHTDASGFIGLGSSGRSDISERTEELRLPDADG